MLATPGIAQSTKASLELPIELVGTSLGATSERAAIIRDTRSNQDDVFSIGQNVLGFGVVRYIKAREVGIATARGMVRLTLSGYGQSAKSAVLSSLRYAKKPIFNDLAQDNVALSQQDYETLVRSGNISGLSSVKEIELPADKTGGKKRGLLFSSIDPKSLFGLAGLKSGDIITQINGTPTTNLDNLIDEVSLYRTQRVVIFVIRQGKPTSFSVQVRFSE